MQLKVRVSFPDMEEEPLEQSIVHFDDIDRIGARVATATRRWLRSVQVRKGPQHTHLGIYAWFEESAGPAIKTERAKRRRKKAADNGAAE